MSVPISFALTYPERAATDVPQLDLAAGLTLEFDAPDLETFPLLALARRPASPAGRTRAPSTRRTRSPSRPSSTGGCRSSASPRSSRRRSRTADGAPARDLAELVEADADARRLADRAECRSHEHLRLDPRARVPDPDPRGGPLLRRARGRDEPAQVLSRLPAGDREDEAERDRVRHRRDPARRLREDPGMHRPGAGRPRRPLRPRDRGGAGARPARRTSSGGASTRTTTTGAQRGARARRARSARRVDSRRSRGSQPSAASTEIEDALGPTRTGARRPGSASPSSSPGPAANLVLAVVALRRALHGRRRQATRLGFESSAARPRRRPGSVRRRSSTINGRAVAGVEIAGRPDPRDQRQAGRR